MTDEAKMVPARSEAEEKWTWNLGRTYKDPAAWEEDFGRIGERVEKVEAWKGKINDAGAARAAFDAEESLDRLIEKLFVYAHLKHDEDTAATEGQALDERIRGAWAEASARVAWVAPEVAAKSRETLLEWAADEKAGPWKRRLEVLAREKEHVLGAEAETALAAMGEVLGAPEQTYSAMTEADMRFGEATDAAGKKHELTEGTYGVLIQSRDGALRRSAFEELYKVYGQWKNTLATTLGATVKGHAADARLRGYPSARAAALFSDQVPEAVYDNLVAATRAALPSFHRYLALRKRALGAERLRMSDLYVPLVPGEAPKASPEESRAWVEAACAPLGAEYGAVLRRLFEERWVDWFENRGKATGAYSSGCYDTPPYLLLNHQGRLDDAFTLAHEAGHSVHTWLANHAQPAATANYPIFLAEIASTTNELLLAHHLLETSGDEGFRKHVLNHLCEMFKGTIFRQVMFAEFERDLHAAAERGEPLVAEGLCEAYAKLNADYYGAAVEGDTGPGDPIALEWARIPHFYYDFYVYKYATSFCAALVFSQRLREGRGREEYLGLLKRGGSLDPLVALGEAGVDLGSEGVVRDAFREFGETVEKLEGALEG